MIRRCLLALVIIGAVGACGGGSGRGDALAEVRVRTPLHVRPVVEATMWGECHYPTGDLLPAVDESECFTLGEDVLLRSYGATYDDETGVEDQATITLTLAPDDLHNFNRLVASCYQGAPACSFKRLAIVFDNKVLVAPVAQAPSFSGPIQIVSDKTRLQPVVARMKH